MNKENTKKLFDSFPMFFRYRDDPMQSLLCFGFECDDGWFDLIFKLCLNIDAVLPEDTREDFYVTQVKEKFGSLRFYVSCAPEEVHELISKAEKASESICEKCGKAGTIDWDEPWVQCLCNKHRDGKEAERKRRWKELKEHGIPKAP